MNIGYIEKLIEFVEESKIDELEVSERFTKIRIRRIYGNNRYKNNYNLPLANIKEKGEGFSEEDKLKYIKSRDIGWFYRTPFPDIGPCVKEGDEILEGQIIGYIKSLKQIGEVKSEFNGIVRKILVNNGEAVDYNKPLLEIELT